MNIISVQNKKNDKNPKISNAYISSHSSLWYGKPCHKFSVKVESKMAANVLRGWKNIHLMTPYVDDHQKYQSRMIK